MEPMMSLREAATAIGARVIGEDVRFGSVSTDSRTLKRGALFVALSGERFDGHRFIGPAKERGAAAAIVQEPGPSRGELPFIVVESSRFALGRLAAHWRGRFDIPLVAVAGSNGKTTVKEMIAAILRAHFGEPHTLANEGNLNNDIGLPLTLLELRGDHQPAGVELGMNHPGETATLAAIASPTVALINNPQREHQEFMRNVAEGAREHGAVFAALRPDGTAVVNADDEIADFCGGLLAGRRVRDFGLDKPAQVSGRHRFTHFRSEIELRSPQGATRIELHADGRHNVLNACAAAACALAAGADLGAGARGLAAFRPVGGRMQRRTTPSGAETNPHSKNAESGYVTPAVEGPCAETGAKIPPL